MYTTRKTVPIKQLGRGVDSCWEQEHALNGEGKEVGEVNTEKNEDRKVRKRQIETEVRNEEE